MTLTELVEGIRPALSPERREFRRLYLAGRFPEARRLAERCYEEGSERVAWVHNLASVATEQGSLREAYSLYLTHAELLADCADIYAVANFHLSYGITAQQLYRLHGTEEYFDRASVAFVAASESYDLAGRQKDSAYAENCYANLLISSNQAEKAFGHIDAAQLLFNDAGEFARAADCEDTRALAYEALGRFVDAFECASRAVVTLERCGRSEAKSIEEARATLERVYEKMKAESARSASTRERAGRGL